MSEPLTPFAYDPRGRVYVAADGPEVYAWSGVDDSPLWKDFADGILVGLSISRDLVLGVDTDGRVLTWRLFDGHRVDVVPQDIATYGLAVDPHGGMALLLQDAVRLLAPSGLTADVPAPGATCVARDASGRYAVVGTRAGRLVWLDAITGAEAGAVAFAGPVHAVVGSPLGGWVVAAGDQLAFVDAEPVVDAVRGLVAVGAPVERVATSADGWLVAARVGRDRVDVFSRADSRRLATVRYKRPVAALGFGLDTWLAIALEHADVNRVELATGKLTRNAPGLGRGSDPWQANLELDAAELRGALVTARAGGAPVAVRIIHGKPEQPQAKGRPWWFIPAILAGAAMFCCGCSGLGAVLFQVFR